MADSKAVPFLSLAACVLHLLALAGRGPLQAAAMVVSQPASTILVSFSVGELLHCFTEMEDKIKAYKEQAFCELWKRDARTIAAARKRMERPMKEELKYYMS